jgi:hypothetical protein
MAHKINLANNQFVMVESFTGMAKLSSRIADQVKADPEIKEISLDKITLDEYNILVPYFDHYKTKKETSTTEVQIKNSTTEATLYQNKWDLTYIKSIKDLKHLSYIADYLGMNILVTKIGHYYALNLITKSKDHTGVFKKELLLEAIKAL